MEESMKRENDRSTHLQTSILSQDYNASEEQTENAN